MQRATICVVALCGVPGCGKSTLARTMSRHVARLPGFEGQHLCVDEFISRSACHGSSTATFSPEAWKEGRAAALRALEGLLQAISRAPGASYQLLIFDDTLHYRSMREECYRLTAKYGAAYLQVHLICPLELAQQRNRQRPTTQQVPPEIVSRTAQLFEDPSSSPLAWERQTVVVDATAAVSIEEVWARVWEHWGPTPPPLQDPRELELRRAEAQRASKESLLHQLELACRRHLGECLRYVAGLPAHQRASLAQRLNGLKRDLLVAARKTGETVNVERERRSTECDRGGGSSEGTGKGVDAQLGGEYSPALSFVHEYTSSAAISEEGRDAKCAPHPAFERFFEHWVQQFSAQCAAAVAAMQEEEGRGRNHP